MFPCVRQACERSKQCNSKSIDFVVDVIKQLSENVVNMLCSDYSDNSDKCDKVVKMDIKTPSKNANKRAKSFIKPIIKILANDSA